MIKLFKNATEYTPQYLGTKDVLVCSDKISHIEDNINLADASEVEVIDTKGYILTPGFVDSLVHITGGGGEGGFSTRTREMEVDDAVRAGVTTLIGVLGTDSITRSLENLLAKTYALNHQGLSVFCYTGSYHTPAVTITGSVTKDIMLFEKVIGLGEVAIADHRSSQLSSAELAKFASEVRVGGMLSGKAGIVSVHVGDEPSRLQILHDVADLTDVPITQFYPTHINRNPSLFEAGLKFAERGGYIDFTTSTNDQILAAGELKAAEALSLAVNRGISIERITMSSDGNASLPTFNSQGELTGLEMGEVKSLHTAFVEAVKNYDVPFEIALASITSSPADILALKTKGRIKVGNDADINLLCEKTLDVKTVYSKGKKILKANS